MSRPRRLPRGARQAAGRIAGKCVEQVVLQNVLVIVRCLPEVSRKRRFEADNLGAGLHVRCDDSLTADRGVMQVPVYEGRKAVRDGQYRA